MIDTIRIMLEEFSDSHEEVISNVSGKIDLLIDSVLRIIFFVEVQLMTFVNIQCVYFNGAALLRKA